MVAAATASGRPVTRGDVTIATLVTPEDAAALTTWVEDLEPGLARHGHDEPRAVQEGAQALVGFDLTTHEGHFMGSGHNRLLLYTQDGEAWVRAAGTWDPMPSHSSRPIAWLGARRSTPSGARETIVEQSMLHQLALQVAR